MSGEVALQRDKRIAGQALSVLSIALGLMTAAAYVVFVKSQIGAIYSLDYGEGVVWWQSANIDNFQLVYKRLDSFPYMVTHYPPVYHWVVRWFTSLVPDWMFAGRIVSLVASLGVGLAVSVLIYRATPVSNRLTRLAPAVMAGTLAYSVYPVFFWSRYARVDMLALLFVFAGLAAFTLSKREAGRFAAFVLFVLAAYTKQTAIMAPTVCLAAAWAVGRASAVRLAGFGLLTGGLPLAWLTWATRGGFLVNTVAYNRNPWEWGRFRLLLGHQLLLAAPVLLLAGLLMAWGVRRAWRGGLRAMLTGSLYDRAVAVMGMYWLCAAASTVAAAKVGGSINYFLDLDVTSCALAGLLIAGALASGRNPIWALVLPAQLAMLAMAFSQCLYDPQTDAARKARARDYAFLLDAVKREPGIVYAEDISLLMRAGKEPPAEPAIITVLAKVGTWDEAPFVQKLAQGQFGMLVIEDLSKRNLYTPRVAEAIEQSYRGIAVTPSGTVYRPRTVEDHYRAAAR